MPLCFAAAREADALTIDIFDVIGMDFWGDGISAKSISRILTTHSDAKAITVRVNSPGGDVFEGTAIYNLLRQHAAKVKVEIIGLAASMASVIALAGDHVAMAENAMFMIHDPWAFAVGSGDDMRKTAEMLDKVKAAMLTVYAGHTTLAKDEIAKLMSAETWMTAEEAKAAGFVDELLPVADPPEGATDAKARARAVLEKFERAPASLLARFAEPRIAAMAQPRSNTMDRDKIIALLGLPKDATDEQIEAALANRPTEAPSLKDAVPRADFEAVRAENARLKAEAEAKARADFEARADAAIADAVEAGKITPASKDYHRKAILKGGAEGLKEFEQYVSSQPALLGNAQMERAEQERGGAATASGGTTEDERKLCKMLGITPEEFAATRKEIAEDHETYAPEAYRYAL